MQKLLPVIAWCAKDADNALRLAQWIQHLGATSDNEFVLLASTEDWETEAGQRLKAYAQFKAFVCVDTSGPVENGWPNGPNQMMAEALALSEQRGAPLLWLEPDAVPLRPGWLQELEREYAQHDAVFIGAWISGQKPHMSGIGVYGCTWRSKSPSLITPKSGVPFDIAGARQIARSFKETLLIQHVPVGRGKVHDFTKILVRPGAAIFHPDKEGYLISKLKVGNALPTTRAIGLEVFQSKTPMVPPPEDVVMRFYHTRNASVPIKFRDGRTEIAVQFQAYGRIGGAIAGTLATEDERVQEFLKVRQEVTEITPEDYQSYVKKKASWIAASRGFAVSPPAVNRAGVPKPTEVPDAARVGNNPLSSPSADVTLVTGVVARQAR